MQIQNNTSYGYPLGRLQPPRHVALQGRSSSKTYATSRFVKSIDVQSHHDELISTPVDPQNQHEVVTCEARRGLKSPRGVDFDPLRGSKPPRCLGLEGGWGSKYEWFCHIFYSYSAKEGSGFESDVSVSVSWVLRVDVCARILSIGRNISCTFSMEDASDSSSIAITLDV